MRVNIGGLDILKVILGILEKLMQKGLMKPSEVEEILKNAADPEMVKRGEGSYQVIEEEGAEKPK